MKKLLSVSIILLASLNLLDMGITTCLLTQYKNVTEINLLMDSMWNISPILFIAYKAILSICLFLVVSHIEKIRKWMYIAIMPATVFYCGVVGWSFYILVNAI